MAEYIALLIRQDDARVRGRIKSISKRAAESAVIGCRCHPARTLVIRMLGNVRLARNQTVSIATTTPDKNEPSEMAVFFLIQSDIFCFIVDF
jgi:hypothetical protein